MPFNLIYFSFVEIRYANISMRFVGIFQYEIYKFIKIITLLSYEFNQLTNLSGFKGHDLQFLQGQVRLYFDNC